MSEPACTDGIHRYHQMATCQCGIQGSGPERAESREGIVTVYDYFGRYVGCMGIETWENLLAAEAPA
jgi:hypothetical protein